MRDYFQIYLYMTYRSVRGKCKLVLRYSTDKTARHSADEMDETRVPPPIPPRNGMSNLQSTSYGANLHPGSHFSNIGGMYHQPSYGYGGGYYSASPYSRY